MATIYDVIILTGSAGDAVAAGNTFTPGADGLGSVSDGIFFSETAPGVIQASDSATFGGTTYAIQEIQYATVTATISDGGPALPQPVSMAFIELFDAGSGTTLRVALPLDGTDLPNISQITVDSVDAASINMPMTVANYDTDDTVSIISGGPDGIVNGADTGEIMSSGYTDAQGDVLDNSGNTILAGLGDDIVYAGTGADTIDGGGGNDQVFAGAGDDSVTGGAGADSIWGEAGEDTLLGNDGDDKLIGGDGDDLLIGGAGDDTLYGDSAFGDLGGLQPGDPAEAGAGNDTLRLDGGNDLAYGGSGNDNFEIYDGFGNHTIVGGETGETTGDTVDGSTLTGDLSVTLTGDEAGTITAGGNTTTFEEIERVELGEGDDTVTVSTSNTTYVNGSDGFDTLVLPDPAPGETPPAVTVTSTVDNGDGTQTFSGFVDFADGSRMEFDNFEEIICFTPGTLIDTAKGRVKVEDLVPGDLVLTRDHGYQPLAWVGRRDLTEAELASCPTAAPIRIAAGSLGRNLPERDLIVSPRHRMLVTGARAELMFGEREVLVTAADLLGLPGVRQESAGAVSYVHVMCADHQIIRAEGSWTESFQPSAVVLGALDADTRAELLSLFPELGAGAGLSSARPVLSPAEARVLFAA